MTCDSSVPVLRLLPYVAVDQPRDAAADALAVYICDRLTPPSSLALPTQRSLGRGDVAVLAEDGFRVATLVDRLAARGVAVAGRGRMLFAAHPVARQYLRALRTIADRDDGPAQAAAFAPPFFAIDPAALLTSIVRKDDTDPQRRVVRQARDCIDELRRRRHRQSVGSTARDLIECSGLGQALASQPTAAATLEVLYALAAHLDERAARDGLDFDAAADLCREWAETEIAPALPALRRRDAVSLVSSEDCRGRPIELVVVWDAEDICLEVARRTARDEVVLAVPLGAKPSAVCADLFASIEWLPVAEPGMLAQPMSVEIVGDPARQARIDLERETFLRGLLVASAPVATPTFATLGGATPEREPDDLLELERSNKVAGARFGALFGHTVRRALQLLFGGMGDVESAVTQAARLERLEQYDHEAVADVRRAVQALEQLGVVVEASLAEAFEYPLVMARADGTLLHGLVDLLVPMGTQLLALEIRCDKPGSGALAKSHPLYARQLALIGELVRGSGLAHAKALKLGVLFTASGEIRWS